jgi:hypothetical protein
MPGPSVKAAAVTNWQLTGISSGAITCRSGPACSALKGLLVVASREWSAPGPGLAFSR